MNTPYRLTYATMFDPPEAMHERFDAALAVVRSRLAARHGLFVNGADVATAHYAARHSPIDSALYLGDFSVAGAEHVDAAMQAAQAAFPAKCSKRSCRSTSGRTSSASRRSPSPPSPPSAT